MAELYTDISYWDELTSEVDFVVGRMAINVTSTDKIPEREFKGLKEFSAGHKDFKLLLVSNTLRKENVIPIIDFLKESYITLK